MTDKKPVGGRRSYQPGRPPKPEGERHKRVTFSLPPDVAEWLMALDRRSEWLTEMVRSVVRSEGRERTSEGAEGRGTAEK